MSREVAEVRQNINMIHEAMQATMKKDTHFGTIPGCGKPTLYKAGAEILIALFKLTFTPKVENLSADGEIRYLVTMDLSTRDGTFIGSGIGECSSGEEKYMWRKAVSDKEFDNTPETLKRVKYKPTYEINQVRVPPADMANTILKMAKKRALIDAVLTATGASDIFTQDIQDLPEGYVNPDEQAPPVFIPEDAQNTPDFAAEQAAKERSELEPPPEQPKVPVISEAQRKRLYAIAMGAGMDKDFFKQWLQYEHEYSSSKDITKADYEKICAAAEAYKNDNPS